MAQLNFDATQVSPEMGVESLPAGWYNAAIDQSDMKPTKDGSGVYLELRFNVLDGQYAQRKVFTRLNIRNANPIAQEIAFKTLSAIAHAVGVLQVADSNQLHGLPMKIKLKVRKDKDGQYDDSNEISSVKNINEQVDGGVPAGVPQGFGPPQGFAPQVQHPGQGFAPQGFPQQGFPQQPAQGFAPPAFPQQPAQGAPQQWQGQQTMLQQGYAAPAQAMPQQMPQQMPAQPWQQQPQQMSAGQPWQQTQQVQPAQMPGAGVEQHPAQSAVPPWGQPQG